MYSDKEIITTGGGTGTAVAAGFVGGIVSRFLTNGNLNEGGGSNVLTYQEGVNAGENFLLRDGMAVQNAIQADINFSTAELTAAVERTGDRAVNAARTGAEANVIATGAVSTKVDALSLFMLGNFKDLDKTLCMQTSDLKAQAVANTQLILNSNQMIRDDICEMREDNYQAVIAKQNCKINDLKDANRELASGNFPIARQGGIVFTDPCRDNHSNEQINIINNNVNAIGSTVTQLAGIVSAMAAKTV